MNGNDKRSDFKHGNPNVFHGKFRLRGGGGVLRWEAAPLPCSVCRQALTDGDGGVLRRCWRTPGRWPSFKEGQNVLDFGASQLAGGGDWRWCKEAVDGGHPCR